MNSMKYFQCLVILLLLFVSQGKTEPKISKVLPKGYTGVWVTSIEACKSVENTNDFDKALIISPNSLVCYEEECNIQKITKLKKDSFKLEVICTGEGMTEKEIFYMKLLDHQTISLRKTTNEKLDLNAQMMIYHKCVKLK